MKRLFLTAAGARLAERTAEIQADVVALMTDGVPAVELHRVRAAMVEVGARLQAAIEAAPPAAASAGKAIAATGSKPARRAKATRVER